jgi:hypothetical protein
MYNDIKSTGYVRNWDQAISEHLYDVNSRGGWGLSRQPPKADQWIPWAMAGMTLAVAVMGWLRGWM